MNKNSNLYIVIYSTVMVVVVATLLAVTAMSLQPRQNANILNEKKEAILATLSAQGENYDEYVTAFAVDENGDKLKSITSNQIIDMLFDLDAAIDNKTFPVFQSKDGRIVVPVAGTGLWGPIWGYIALEKNLNTIAGVVFDHTGETPGLGAEISTTPFEDRFKGKQIFNGGKFVSVTLVKGGAKVGNPYFDNEIDGISGGTKTADGVSEMLSVGLKNYLPFIEKSKQESNVENIENNE